MVLPPAMAARCSSPVRQWACSAARPLRGMAKLDATTVGTTQNRQAAAQYLNADANAGLHPVSRTDLSTDLDIGRRIGLSIGCGVATLIKPPPVGNRVGS